MVSGGQTAADDQQDHDRLQGLFATLPAEEWIRKDLKDAAQHGSAAMLLGGCAANN
jgi:muconolactone delta-isomerase